MHDVPWSVCNLFFLLLTVSSGIPEPYKGGWGKKTKFCRLWKRRMRYPGIPRQNHELKCLRIVLRRICPATRGDSFTARWSTPRGEWFKIWISNMRRKQFFSKSYYVLLLYHISMQYSFELLIFKLPFDLLHHKIIVLFLWLCCVMSYWNQYFLFAVIGVRSPAGSKTDGFRRALPTLTLFLRDSFRLNSYGTIRNHCGSRELSLDAFFFGPLQSAVNLWERSLIRSPFFQRLLTVLRKRDVDLSVRRTYPTIVSFDKTSSD